MRSKTHLVLSIVLAALFLVSAIFYANGSIHAQADRPLPPAADNTIIPPDVTVIWQTPESYTAEISAYGAVEPHFDVTLTAQVAGQVRQTSQTFEAGEYLSKGQWLARLDDTDYTAAVAEAQEALSSASVALMEEEREAQQAALEWSRSGLEGEPDSDLVLRQPQLAAAKSSLAQAEANLKKAKRDLEYAQVTMPFDGIIISRSIAPGSYVQTGEEVAQLYSTDYAEVKVSLSEREWLSLPDFRDKTDKWAVTVESVESHQQWQGYVLRTEQHLDGETRQRSLVVAVDQPFNQQPALFPGTFVNISLAGIERDNLWQLPSSALSQRGEIWYVNEHNSLDKFAASAVFSKGGDIFIQVPSSLSELNVAVLTHPLNGYLTGMAVTPVELSNE